ncbi:MAG: C25 family cysteine peptidase [Candidatus Delongbacteria bacterium]|jgi:hypothetical protein|nr:C25 family cysteine peptidase [Candidatus Delongbacteria bacterium]
MRKLLIVLMVIAMTVFAANNAILDASKITGYKIQSDTDSYLDIDFTIKDINISEVITEKGVFSSVTIDNGYITMEAGSPALPAMHEMIAMPYGATPEVEVISYDSKIYKLSELGISNKIIPAQPSYSKSSKPEDRVFVYNESAYTASKFNDDAIAVVSKSGTMRGVGVGVLKVYPFKYNPTAGTIEVYNNLKVRVNYVNADPRAEEIKTEAYSPYFESAYSSMINYKPSTAKADLMNWPVTYLIVASSGLNGNADLQRFIDWKTEKGFNVIVNYVTSATTIFDNDVWVEQQWNTLNPKPSFVLLVGDEDGTFVVEAQDNPSLGSAQSVSISDLVYGVIGTTGSSNRIPSMYVGRFSVRSAAELTAQVDKTIWYEKEQFTTSYNLNYLTRPLGVAGVDASFSASHGDPHISYGWTYYFTSANGMANNHYYLSDTSDNSTTEAEIVAFISAGANFYNYTAHGMPTYFAEPEFTITDINGLNNANEYPLVVGNCCLTNSFGEVECFGEAWLNAADEGGIGYIGASMNTYWDEDLAMGVGIGDASVQNTNPPDLDIANPGMYDGVMELDYSSQASIKHVGLMAVENSGSGYTDAYWSSYHLMGDPSVQIFFGIPSDATASYDGVMAPGATSFAVNTDPGAYIGMTDQSGNLHGAARADGSGVANVTITPYTVGDEVNIVITNQFKKPYFATIMCTGSTGGTFSQSTSSLGFGSLDIGASNTLQFTISNSHNDEYLMGDITTIAGYIVTLAAKGDVKDVKNVMSYSVGPNSSKTFDLKFEPASGGAFNGNITITSTDTNHATETIAVTGTCIVPDITAPADVSASAAPGNSVIKNFNIANDDAGSLDYNIAINYTSGKDIKATGGPDTYGYKWKDSDEADGPVYNWVEINGDGTGLGLGDDGEASGLNLGFTFNYYGIDYTTIDVGANGAATFTPGGAIDWQNPTIPSADAPDAILAAFWDDLNPTSGGEIYYYSDVANNRFIIEWDGVYEYGTGGLPMTFEIILYESGKIVYQYKDMSGVLDECTIGIEDHNGTDGNLVVNLAPYVKNNLAIQFQATPEWLSLDNTSGTIAGNSSLQIAATCDATELELGVYTADLTVTTNDPDEPTTIIPVTFTVSNIVTPGITENVVTSIVGTNLVIDWWVAADATSYDVYSSDDPYGTFTFVANVATNQYTVAADQAKLFYYIISKN